MIYDKWWKSPGLTCTDELKNKDGKANPLGLGNIGGVFVVLLLGLAAALFSALMEFMLKNPQNQSFSMLRVQKTPNAIVDESNMMNSESSQTYPF